MRTHPDPVRIREVMDAIVESRSNLRLPSEIDMLSIENPFCGTPGCHAGELYIGLTLLGLGSQAVDSDGIYMFTQAADAFAKFVFHSPTACKYDLTYWGRCNRELWGNSNGGAMFVSDYAFSGFKNGTKLISPHQITDHWYAVADRIEALEAKGG